MSARRPGSRTPISPPNPVGAAALAVAMARTCSGVMAGEPIPGWRWSLLTSRISWSRSSSSLMAVLSVPMATLTPPDSMGLTGAMPFLRRRLELAL